MIPFGIIIHRAGESNADEGEVVRPEAVQNVRPKTVPNVRPEAVQNARPDIPNIRHDADIVVHTEVGVRPEAVQNVEPNTVLTSDDILCDHHCSLAAA